MKPKPTPKRGIIKAFIVVDGKGVPLSVGNMLDGFMERLLVIYTGEKEARRAWDGFTVLPISFSIPRMPRGSVKKKLKK